MASRVWHPSPIQHLSKQVTEFSVPPESSVPWGPNPTESHCGEQTPGGTAQRRFGGVAKRLNSKRHRKAAAISFPLPLFQCHHRTDHHGRDFLQVWLICRPRPAQNHKPRKSPRGYDPWRITLVHLSIRSTSTAFSQPPHQSRPAKRHHLGVSQLGAHCMAKNLKGFHTLPKSNLCQHADMADRRISSWPPLPDLLASMLLWKGRAPPNQKARAGPSTTPSSPLSKAPQIATDSEHISSICARRPKVNCHDRDPTHRLARPAFEVSACQP